MTTITTLPLKLELTDINQSELLDYYKTVRQFTEKLCEPLQIEDYVIQTMEDVSPTKWHLAHSSWFFEAMILRSAVPGYQDYHPKYNYLFNSYYNSMGEQFDRPSRGLLSRPTVAEIYKYRHYVDSQIESWLMNATEDVIDEYKTVLITGINHEQQHQELLLTDVKHVLSMNPITPVYASKTSTNGASMPELQWVEIPEGIYEIGYQGDGFFYDNEGPAFRAFIEPIKMANRLITNREYKAFIDDNGYRNHHLWLSAGWNHVQTEGWKAPIYWQWHDGGWYEFTLNGLVPLNLDAPVSHVSYFEADAFARWANARLPREEEWEAAAKTLPVAGNFVESMNFHPVPLTNEQNADHVSQTNLQQMYGDVWEWTQSAYSPYPGYRATRDALGEYNGKWMCNQYVLKGGSCATSQSHIRLSYRNFFPAHARWQFMGIRLVKD